MRSSIDEAKTYPVAAGLAGPYDFTAESDDGSVGGAIISMTIMNCLINTGARYNFATAEYPLVSFCPFKDLIFELMSFHAFL
jgi:hypothetical protein